MASNHVLIDLSVLRVGFRRLGAATALAALAACVLPSVVQYTAFHNREFAERKQPAEIQQKPTTELLNGGYLLIGYIDLRRNVRTCYEDGTCVNHSDTLPNPDDLRQQAARRGGDVVTLLEERTLLEQNNKSVCTGYTTTTYYVNKVPHTTTTCSGYRTTPGKLEAKITRALVWRHDPEAARGEANARAIEAALKTLEGVYRADQTKTGTAGGSFFGGLAKAFSGKDEVAREKDDPLGEQIYRAIDGNDSAALYALARDGKLQAWSDAKGRTALMLALASGRPEAARTLLAIDKNLERRDRAGMSALHYAAAHADVALVRELGGGGYDVRARTKDGASLLWFALYNPKRDGFDWLLEQGLQLRERTSQNETLLMTAAASGRAWATERVLALGLEPNDKDSDGRTALMYAARNDRPAAVQLLLKRGASADVTDQYGNTVLHYAAVGGSTELIQALLQRGLNKNSENKQGATPLATAFGAGRWGNADFLIKRGAALTTRKFSAEDAAAFLITKDQPQLLRHYVAAFPTLKEMLSRDPDWFQLAAKRSGRATLRYLAELGARIDHRGKDRLTPLMTAASAGNDEAVRALLELKSDPTQRDARGQTALRMATVNGHAKAVEALRDFGVKE